jgi:lysozyme
MTRRLNEAGLELLKTWEGCELESYPDVGGVWTVGYGHTKTAHPNMTITQDEADRLLDEDLSVFADAVEKAVKVPLSDNQFAALVVFAYNVGQGAFRKSTLLRKLNEGDYSAVPPQLMRWNKVQGKEVRGLTNRRAAEVKLWST